jgi:hypothetical protein
MRHVLFQVRPMIGAMVLTLLPALAHAQARAMTVDSASGASSSVVQPHRATAVAPARMASAAMQQSMSAFVGRVGAGAKTKGRPVVARTAAPASRSSVDARPVTGTGTASAWRLGSPRPVTPAVRAKGGTASRPAAAAGAGTAGPPGGAVRD